MPQLPRLQTRIINNATLIEWWQGLHELIYLNLLVPDIKASAQCVSAIIVIIFLSIVFVLLYNINLTLP